jgi:hypothetical protein
MKTWQGRDFLDDRVFILDLRPAAKAGRSVWAIVACRNVRGSPPRRVDEFETQEDALAYLRQVEPSTPRISLGGQSPSPQPTYDEYLAWCWSQGIPDCMQIHQMNQERRRAELIIQEVSSEELAEPKNLSVPRRSSP